jgi:hypothetical protein
MAKASQDKQLMELIKHIQQKRGRWWRNEGTVTVNVSPLF